MNQSEKKLLIRLLEQVRRVYGQTEFIKAYDITLECYSKFLNIKDMVDNQKFNSIAQKEIDKAFKYANRLGYSK